MGSLILCHNRRAKQPYLITRTQSKIYTIEELCYYICNNLYLIDYTIMNRQLCNWIDSELGMTELADALREELMQNATEEQFVLQILKSSHIYAQSEINKVQVMMERLSGQKDVEKAKYKADSLFNGGQYSSAVLVYQSIVGKEWDDSLDRSYYGKVYACLGSAYGRLLLYEEAAAAYKEAYRICEDEDILKAYIYSCMKGLPLDEYTKMLSGNPAYLSMDAKLKEILREAEEQKDEDIDPKRLAAWKKECR